MIKCTARRRARKYAMQAIYSWQISGNYIYDIEHQFLEKLNIINFDTIYFHDLLAGVTTNNIYLDKIMKPYLFCSLDMLGQVEKAVLRIALFELCKRNDIPFKVTINEAIELTKIFGAEDSYKFVNSILHKIAYMVLNIKE